MYWASNTFTLPAQGRDKEREITKCVVEKYTAVAVWNEILKIIINQTNHTSLQITALTPKPQAIQKPVILLGKTHPATN